MTQLSEQRSTILESIDIRNMLMGDLPFWTNIEESSFTNPWLVNDWYEFRENIYNQSIAACYDNYLVGYAFYINCQDEVKNNYLQIVKLVVHPSLRRGGIGSKLINRVKEGLNKDCQTLSTVLDERNIHGQMFLKKHMFDAVFVKKNFFGKNTSEVMDGYLFEFCKKNI